MSSGTVSTRVGGSRRQKGRGNADRRALGEQILAGRNKGQTMHAISRELGISEPSAYRYMNMALEARIAPTVDAFRAQQNDRLDETQRVIDENMRAADILGRRAVEEDSPALLERAVTLRNQTAALQIRLDERRAKLNGLDAPIKVDAVVTTQDIADAELQAMIREAQQRVEEMKRGA